MTNSITTDTFKLTPAVYFKIAVGAILPRLIFMSILALLITLIVSLVIDIIFVLITLIIIFIIIPIIISHIYFSKLLTSEAQYALMPKHVNINPGTSITETFENIDETHTPPQPRQWQWNKIKSHKISNKHIVINFFNNDYTLIIPLKSINRNIDISWIANPIE